MLLNCMGDVHSFKALLLILLVEPFHFPIQTMPYLFKHDVSVRINPWMLAFSRNLLEDLIDIRHIEITTKSQILCSPVIPP